MVEPATTETFMSRIIKLLKQLSSGQIAGLVIAFLSLLAAIVALPQIQDLIDGDPRSNLIKMGYSWSQDDFNKSINQGDVTAIKYFSEDGMPVSEDMFKSLIIGFPIQIDGQWYHPTLTAEMMKVLINTKVAHESICTKDYIRYNQPMEHNGLPVDERKPLMTAWCGDKKPSFTDMSISG